MKETVLKIDNLFVEYKNRRETVKAVNGISFEIAKGETLGLVGETGAGKTTTALSILRLLPEKTGRIAEGTIYFNGEDLQEKSAEEMRKIRGNRIAMVFQDPMTSLNPVFTIEQQIAECVKVHTGKTDEEITEMVKNILKLVGIAENRKKCFPHELSGGMKQRVVIAMGLINNPELLIADEATTALDVTIQAQVLELMNNLKKQFNTAMIMIAHDLGIVAETCDKVAVMYAGEIVEMGTLRDIYKGELHHPYTVGLFGSLPSVGSSKERLKPIEGMLPDPSNLPSGCYFSDRCPKATERCRKEKPGYFVEGTHSILCHLFKENNHG